MPVLGGFASTYDRGLRLVVVPVVGLAQQPTKVPVCMEFLGTLVGFGSRFLCDPAVIAGGAPEHGLTQRLVLSDADGLMAGRTDDAAERWFRWHLRQVLTGSFTSGRPSPATTKSAYRVLRVCLRRSIGGSAGRPASRISRRRASTSAFTRWASLMMRSRASACSWSFLVSIGVVTRQ